MMSSRKSSLNERQEPKVIALAATRTKISETLIWQIGMALLVYSWLHFLG